MKELLFYAVVIVFVCFVMTCCDKFLDFLKSKFKKKKEVEENGK